MWQPGACLRFVYRGNSGIVSFPFFVNIPSTLTLATDLLASPSLFHYTLAVVARPFVMTYLMTAFMLSPSLLTFTPLPVSGAAKSLRTCPLASGVPPSGG